MQAQGQEFENGQKHVENHEKQELVKESKAGNVAIMTGTEMKVTNVEMKVPQEHSLLVRLSIWALPRAAWITFMVLIIVWIMDVEGKFGFNQESVFGWHACLMSGGFAVFSAEGILAYTAPIWDITLKGNTSRNISKAFHGLCHLATLACAILAMVAIVDYKKWTVVSGPYNDYTEFPFFHLYTAHSFFGLVLLFSWFCQWVAGLMIYGVLSLPEETKKYYAHWHQFTGKSIFLLGLATCAMGLQDMQMSDLCPAGTPPEMGYPPHSMFAQIAGAAACVLIVLGMSVMAPFSLVR